MRIICVHTNVTKYVFTEEKLIEELIKIGLCNVRCRDLLDIYHNKYKDFKKSILESHIRLYWKKDGSDITLYPLSGAKKKTHRFDKG